MEAESIADVLASIDATQAELRSLARREAAAGLVAGAVAVGCFAAVIAPGHTPAVRAFFLACGLAVLQLASYSADQWAVDAAAAAVGRRLAPAARPRAPGTPVVEWTDEGEAPISHPGIRSCRLVLVEQTSFVFEWQL